MDAGSDTTICPGGTAVLDASGTGDGALIYSWAPSLGLSCDDCPNPNANPASTTTYTVTITDEDNCTSSDQVTVNVANLPDPTFNFLPNSSCANTPVQFAPVDVTPGLSTIGTLEILLQELRITIRMSKTHLIYLSQLEMEIKILQ